MCICIWHTTKRTNKCTCIRLAAVAAADVRLRKTEKIFRLIVNEWTRESGEFLSKKKLLLSFDSIIIESCKNGEIFLQHLQKKATRSIFSLSLLLCMSRYSLKFISSLAHFFSVYCSYWILDNVVKKFIGNFRLVDAFFLTLSFMFRSLSLSHFSSITLMVCVYMCMFWTSHLAFDFYRFVPFIHFPFSIAQQQ